MVVIAYLVFSLWLVDGAVFLADRSRVAGYGAWALIIAMVFAQLYQQLPDRLAAARQSPAQQFVEQTFAVLPPQAVAIAGWHQFAALKYGQAVQGRRPDVDVILPAETERFYNGARVANYLDYVAAEYCRRPILTHKVTAALTERFDLQPVAGSPGWYRLDAGAAPRCGQARASSGGARTQAFN
jgi:hypothetical protein